MSIMLHKINKFNELSRISVKTQFNVNNKQDLHLGNGHSSHDQCVIFTRMMNPYLMLTHNKF
jgi:hypothetical protein